MLALSALFVALTVITLYSASVWPTGLFGLVAFASMFCAATVIDAGISYGLYVYIISAILGIILLPDKAAPVLYIFFFGYYPIVKSLIEHLKAVLIQWALKLLVFNTSLTIILFFFKGLILNLGDNPPGLLLIYPAASVVFLLFDYGYTKLIWFYIDRISKHTRS